MATETKIKKLIQLLILEAFNDKSPITLQKSPLSETIYVYIWTNHYCKIRISTHTIDTINYHYQIIIDDNSDVEDILYTLLWWAKEEHYNFDTIY